MKRFGAVVFVGLCFLAGFLFYSPMSFAADEPASEEVISTDSGSSKMTTEKIAAEEAVAEETAAEEAVVEEEAAAEETATEEAVVEEEAAAEETATEEAAVEEEAAAEETATEEAAVEEEAAAEETATEEQAEEVEKAPVGKAELKESLVGASEAIGAISVSLNELSGQQKAQEGGGDLRGVFDKFQTELKTLKDKNDALNETYAQMKGNMESSLDAWKIQLGSINNEKIRKSAEKRRESSLKTFERVVKEMEVIEKDLASLAGILGDVESYLTFDLTSAGISELGTSLRDATKKADAIQKNITGIQGTLGNLPEVQ